MSSELSILLTADIRSVQSLRSLSGLVSAIELFTIT